MKQRSLSGNAGVLVFAMAFVCICVAFGTPSWLVSDQRITGAKLDRLGLWVHCFRSLADPSEPDQPKRFYQGCRWVYDPFTAGYNQIRGFLLPPFMIVTQLFFTLCFLLMLISCGLTILYSLCCDAEQQRFVQLIKIIGFLQLIAGICGCIAVIVFAFLGNTKGWMPGQENNFFGWSFAIGVIGSILCLIVATLFLVEANVQEKKRKYLKESQMRFQMEAKG